MIDEKLDKLLKEDIVDVPEVKINSKKIVEYCIEKTNKRNVNRKRLVISLSSFVILTLIVLSFVLMNNQYYSDVIKVNKAIDGLDNIDDSSAKIQEIMNINNEIKTLSLNSQEKVNMDKLTYELKTTTTNLKNAVDWSDVINNDATYFTFDEIINKTEVKELFVKKNLITNTTIRLNNSEFIDSLIETFYLPYIDIIDSKESFYEDYKIQLSGDTNDFCNFQINDYDSTSEPLFNIYVYGSGYVLITETLNNVLTKAFISLISLDYSEFKLTYGAYSITSDFYFHEIVSFESIKFISVTESTYWALLGMPYTYISNDQMFDYYNNKLKNLKFTENDELVKSIQSELGSTLDNDTYSITISLIDNDSISLFISKTTHRFIITHGMMSYAGVGAIEHLESFTSHDFIVKFYDDGKIIKEEMVKLGSDATPPVMTNKPFYYFDGWDTEYDNVHSNLEIHSMYRYGVVDDTTGLLEDFLKQNLDVRECKTLKTIDENHIIVYLLKNRQDIERELNNKNVEYTNFHIIFGSIYYDNIIDDLYIVYDYTSTSENYGYITCLSRSGERVIPGSLAYCGLSSDELLTDIPWTIVRQNNPIEYRQDLEKINISKDEFDLMVEVVKNYNNSNLEGYEIDGTISNSKTYSVSGDFDVTEIRGNIASSKYVGLFDGFILLELHLQHVTYDVKYLYEVFGDRIIIENVDDRLLLYKDGKCYTITEAYNSGLISLETIYSIPCYQVILEGHTSKLEPTPIPDPNPEPTPSEDNFVIDKLGNKFEICGAMLNDDLNVIFEINDLKVQDLHGGVYLGPGTVKPFVDRLIQFLSIETFEDLKDLSIVFGFGYKRGTTPDEVFNWEDVYSNDLVLKSINGDEETIIFQFNDLNEYKKYSLINTASWASTPDYHTSFKIKIKMADYLNDNSTTFVLESGNELLCKFSLKIEENNEVYKIIIVSNE